jgi:hypothetical protein
MSGSSGCLCVWYRIQLKHGTGRTRPSGFTILPVSLFFYVRIPVFCKRVKAFDLSTIQLNSEDSIITLLMYTPLF